TDLYLISAKPLDEGGCCVRQNRVVLASVADATPCGDASAQPGFDKSSIREATVTKRIRRRGERGISRKPIAQGMPECSGCTCMLVCALLYTLHTRPRVQQAPGIPCSLCLRDDVIQTSDALRREKVRPCLRTLTQTNSLCPAKSRAGVR